MRRTSPREIEVKRLLVGERAGERLLDALGARVESRKQQRNHVFDTSDHRLGAARHALRLRDEDGTFILTAKGPSRTLGASTADKLEAEIRVDQPTAAALLAGSRDPVSVLRAAVTESVFDELWQGIEQALAGSTLGVLGSFDNERRVVPVKLPSGQTLTLELDRTSLPDGSSEEEVEIELPSAALALEVEDWLEETARAAGVSTAASAPKIARFVAALARRQGGPGP